MSEIHIEPVKHLWGIAAVRTDDGRFIDAELLAIGTNAPPDSLVSDAEFSASAVLDCADHADYAAPDELFSDLPANTVLQTVVVDPQSEVNSPVDAHLRLQAMSRLLVLPRSISFTNVFAELPLMAFTSHGPIHPSQLDTERRRVRKAGQQLIIQALDKFPPLLNYLHPQDVRIGDGSRVRLGAHLAPGTVIMHEGFCNFNAGTLGTAMVEGRISQGVIVDSDSDLGGSASIMGTLSGGNNIPLSVGKQSLIGANAGLGIPLGNGCTIEAGLYITAGTKVTLHEAGKPPRTCKAEALAFHDGLLFRRNSQSGAVEVLQQEQSVALNQDLHANSD